MSDVTFSHRSHIFTGTSLRYKFLPTVGYVTDCCCIKAIVGRSLGMKIDNMHPYYRAVFSSYNKTNATKYVEATIKKCLEAGTIMKRDHNVFNIPKHKLNGIDRFLSSLTILTDPHWYMQITGTLLQENHHHNHVKFHKLPFQQFMLLDKLFMILMRSDVVEYADLILMEMKHTLGLSCMTLTDCHVILNRFNKKVVTHIIPRRHGKTIFTNFLNGMCLVLFPSASLKMLYVAQNKDLTNNAFKCIQSIVPELSNTFNQDQKEAYAIRRRLLQENGDEFQDFFYKVKTAFHVHSGSVSCSFYKETFDTELPKDQLFVTNQISCVVYREKNVSKNFHQ